MHLYGLVVSCLLERKMIFLGQGRQCMVQFVSPHQVEADVYSRSAGFDMVRSRECTQATLAKFIGGNLKKKKECQHLIRRQKIVHVYFC